MKIAYLMNGIIGGLSGKNYEGLDDDLMRKKIIKYTSNTHLFFEKNVEIDYFIFSWEPELEKTYIKHYNPVMIKSISQIKFEMPNHYLEHKDNPRIQAHYSRWYGALEVSKMCKDYSLKNNINYDLIVNARLDLCFTKNIDFTKFHPYQFHIANPVNLPTYNWPKSGEIIDHIFISNPTYMFEFMKMFAKLNEYTTPGQCPQWKLISNHFLSVWHLNKIGILEPNIISDLLLKTYDGGYDENSNTDYYIFRYKDNPKF